MQATSATIRPLALTELDTAFQLIWEVFQQFVSPDYTKEGSQSFYTEFVQGQAFRDTFAAGEERMFGAYVGRELAGVLSLSRKNTVSCVFVKGAYHRRGIGRQLFGAVIRELRSQGVATMRLNASPYAVPFYHAIGFVDTGDQADYKGIRYTPMQLTLSDAKTD